VPTAEAAPVSGSPVEAKDDRLAEIRRLHFYSSFAWSVEHLTAFLGLKPEDLSFNPFSAPRDSEAIAGWGIKPRSRYAMQAAARRGLPYVALEEGFLRSVGFGQQYVEPLSIIVDPVGIYYDSTRSSWLERLLEEEVLDDPVLLARAEAAIAMLRAEKLTKFNTAPTVDETELYSGLGDDFILVVDQTFNDESVLRSGAGPDPFTTMLRQARLDHPDRRIVIKSHTTVLNTAGPGYFAAPDASDGRVTVFDRDINPWQLLERCHAVYTVSSQLGFEALMAGKPVTCFGLPFYAGWGLTRDRVACPRRGRRRSLAQIFTAAYLLYPTYVDPYLGRRCDFERAAEILLFLRARNETNRVATSLVGLRRHELRAASRLYRQAGGHLTVTRRRGNGTATRPQGTSHRVLLGERHAADLPENGAENRQAAFQVLAQPFAERLLAPWMSGRCLGFRRTPVDEAQLGDAAWRARLTTMTCGAEDRRRARQLIAALRGLEHHLGEGRHGETPRVPEVPIILAVIEADEWRQRETVLGMLAHLLECSTSQDGAHRQVVVASPHGAKLKAILRECACRPGDGLTHVPLDAAPALVARAAELHVVDSPLGVLGLVHGKNVVVHGWPIYAGFGLTEDRRKALASERELSLEELIAGLFLHAHDYLDPRSGYPGELAWILAPAGRDRAPRLRFQLDSRTAVKIDYTLGKVYSLPRLWPAGRG